MNKKKAQKMHNVSKPQKLVINSLAGIEVCLKQADLENTTQWYLSFYNEEYERKISDYFDEMFESTPRDIRTLCYEVPYSKLLARFTQWLFYASNLLARNKKNTSERSKLVYEKLAFNDFELSFNASPNVLVRNKVPVLASIWTQNLSFIEHLKRGFNQIGQIGSVLEVGCGEGRIPFTICLADPEFFNKVRYVGFDYSFYRVLKADRLCKKYLEHPPELYNGDVTLLKHADKEFDVVFTNCVLEQIKYGRDIALSEMQRVAKYMVITEPFYEYQSRFAKAHLAAQDYIRLEVCDLEKYGEILDINVHGLQDPTYGYVTVVVKNN